MTPIDAFAPAEEAAHQRAGGAAGGGVVDADIVQPAGGGRVRHQRHHGDAGAGEIVDGVADAGVVERDGGDAVEAGTLGLQRGGEHVGVEDVDMDGVDEGALAGEPLGGLADLVGQQVHEGVAAHGQDEAEAEGAVARQPRGGGIRPVAELEDGRLDPGHGPVPDARTPVDDAVHGGQRHARFARNVLQLHPVVDDRHRPPVSPAMMTSAAEVRNSFALPARRSRYSARFRGTSPDCSPAVHRCSANAGIDKRMRGVHHLRNVLEAGLTRRLPAGGESPG